MEERARRVKSLLEGYYGTGSAGGEDDSFAALKSSSARTDVNSKGFDPDAYISGLLRTSKLEDLLQQHVGWAAEIKNLDSDMQMLVYENYSKFISATDTIRKMKDNVGNMEWSMDKLLETVTAVQEKSDAITASLCERRERIEQLNGTRSLLRKSQFIFDLPKRLHHSAKAENYAKAVAVYLGALPILESYGDTSFKSVKEEADGVMAGVTRRLRHQVMSDAVALGERERAAALLQKLNQPMEELMDEYLALHWERLLRQLREAAEAANRAREANSSTEEAVQQSIVDGLNRDFVEDFERTASCFRGIFRNGNEKLTASTRELFNEYVSHVQKTMQKSEESRSMTSTADLMLALKNLSRDVAKMSELVPGASLAQRASEAMEAAVREHIVQCFALHELRIKDEIQGLCRSMKQLGSGAGGAGGAGPSAAGGGIPRAYSVGLDAAQAVCCAATLQLLEGLHSLLDTDADLLLSHHDDFILLLHSELTLLFTEINSLFHSLCDAPSASAPPSPVLLILARLAQKLQQSDIARISMAVDDLFPFPNTRLDAADDSNSFCIPHFAQLFEASSEKLLHQYVDVEAKKLCLMITKSVTTPNWDKYKEPKDVRMVVDLILQEIDGVHEVCRQLLEAGADKGARTVGGGSSQARPSSRASVNVVSGARAARSRAIEREVANLFKHESESSTKLLFTQMSVLSTLIRMLLEAFLDCVKQQTFGRNGYQQIQLDALFLCDNLRCLVEDGSVVDSLMDQVCTAAAEHSTDPMPMDAALVDKILLGRKDRR